MAKIISCDYCGKRVSKNPIVITHGVTLEQGKEEVIIHVSVNVRQDDDSNGDEAICEFCALAAVKQAFK